MTCNTKPSEGKSLVRDLHGETLSGELSYSSIVGMMLYFAGYLCLDTAYAVNCAMYYMFCQKYIHELLLKRIGRCMKGTRNQGLVLIPLKKLKTDLYSDEDFVGLYGYKI